MKSVHFRFPEPLIERLDALAAERQIGRSRLVRQLLDVGLRDRPAPLTVPLTEDELVAVLNERARNGNVAATRTLLARIERDDPPRERQLAEFLDLMNGGAS